MRNKEGNILVALMFLLPYLGLAEEPEAPVKFGFSIGESKGLVSSAYHLFNENKDTDFFDLNLPRYGSSFNRLQVGNGIGISINSVVGFTKSVEFMTIGIEPTSGRFVINSNPEIQSYYEWTPMLTLGPKFTLCGIDLSFHGRYGFAVGDMGLVGFGLEADTAYGFAAYAHTRLIQIAAESTYIGAGTLIKNIDVKTGYFIMRFEDVTSIRNEQSFMMLFSW